jgi:hypothetical protein
MTDNHYLVPTQQEGLEKDITHSIIANTMEDAEDWFVDAKERLMAVNNWKKWTVMTSADFKLTDSHGNAVNRRARKGDHIRIDLPSSFDMEGGFDWVTIEAIEYDDYPDFSTETFAMRLRPSIHPQDKKGHAVLDSPGNDATSTFVIERRGKRLSATYHGRNEAEHNDSNVMVGTIAWLGMSDVQCAALVKGFVG